RNAIFTTGPPCGTSPDRYRAATDVVPARRASVSLAVRHRPGVRDDDDRGHRRPVSMGWDRSGARELRDVIRPPNGQRVRLHYRTEGALLDPGRPKSPASGRHRFRIARVLAARRPRSKTWGRLCRACWCTTTAEGNPAAVGSISDVAFVRRAQKLGSEERQ